ncbi:putative FMN/FAD exporter YeeO [Rubritalea halochordaticola]|uniref:Multidrug-efflux transporter n=1 Tax=Rubritalea halochordaticola TaxID=714537 RepID=A0ABP9UZ98_9BACT
MSESIPVSQEAKESAVPVTLGGRLAGLSLPRQIIALALWPLLQNMMGTLVSFADRIIAGRMFVGEELVAAMDTMGLAMYVGWLMMIMQGAIATGAQALAARGFGAGDQELVEKATGQSMVLGTLSGCVSGLLLWLFRGQLISMFGLTEIAAHYANQYITWISLAAPLSGILFVCNACQRAGGDTLTPFYAMVVVNIVNVAMSVGLMLYVLPAEQYGVSGLALGTVGGWLAGALVVLYTLRPAAEGKAVVVIRRENLRWESKTIKRVVKVGIPQFVEIIGMWAIHAYGVRVVAGLETEGMVGAHGMVVQIESLSFMPGFALGMAASTLAGQYLGAQSKELARHAVRVCWGLAVLTMGLAGICLILFAEPLVALMSPGGGAQAEAAVRVLRIIGFVQPFFATAMVMKISMRGVGATKTVMAGSFSVMICIRIGVLTYAAQYWNPDLTMVWLIMSADLVVQAIVFVILHFRGKWLDTEV